LYDYIYNIMGLLQSTPASPVSLVPGPDVDVKPAWAAELPATSPVVYFDVSADGEPIGECVPYGVYRDQGKGYTRKCVGYS
jgi:hypothetical protein